MSLIMKTLGITALRVTTLQIGTQYDETRHSDPQIINTQHCNIEEY